MNSKPFEKLDLKGFRRAPGADDPSRIGELEKAVGYSLPADYREFLLERAPSIVAGEVVFRSIECSPWSEDGCESIEVFFGLARGTTQDITRNYLTVDSDVPAGMFPIGYDSGANRILMALDEPPGRVYFQDKDTGDVYLCARTFTDFINSFEYAPYGRPPAEQ